MTEINKQVFSDSIRWIAKEMHEAGKAGADQERRAKAAEKRAAKEVRNIAKLLGINLTVDESMKIVNQS